MRIRLLLAAFVAAIFSAPTPALAGESSNDDGNESAFTIAVIGDWPYNDQLLANSDLLAGSINADRAVKTVIHVGDLGRIGKRLSLVEGRGGR